MLNCGKSVAKNRIFDGEDRLKPIKKVQFRNLGITVNLQFIKTAVEKYKAIKMKTLLLGIEIEKCFAH